MFTVYAKKEPMTDSVFLKYGTGKKFDAQVYKDENCLVPFARFMWDSSGRLTKRNKKIIINCFRYNLEWR